VTIFPRALYQLPLESVPTFNSHLSPFPSTEATTTELPLPPHQICFPVVHYLCTGAASPSATTSAPELLPHRPLPRHQSCFPVGHYLRTRAAPPSSTTSAPDLVHRRLVPPHWICFPVGHYLRTGAAPSVGEYLRQVTTPTIDHGRSRYARSIFFAQSFPSSSSSMEPIVGLYSPSCQQPATSHRSPASQKYFCLTTNQYQPLDTTSRTRSGQREREREREKEGGRGSKKK